MTFKLIADTDSGANITALVDEDKKSVWVVKEILSITYTDENGVVHTIHKEEDTNADNNS
jgi:hypothetical protein